MMKRITLTTRYKDRLRKMLQSPPKVCCLQERGPGFLYNQLQAQSWLTLQSRDVQSSLFIEVCCYWSWRMWTCATLQWLSKWVYIHQYLDPSLLITSYLLWEHIQSTIIWNLLSRPRTWKPTLSPSIAAYVCIRECNDASLRTRWWSPTGRPLSLHALRRWTFVDILRVHCQ